MKEQYNEQERAQDCCKSVSCLLPESVGAGMAAPLGTYVDRRTSQHHDALGEMISYYRLRANQLEALQRSLPLELPIGASEALAAAIRLL